MVLCKETMYTGIDDLKKAVHFFKSSLSVYIVRNEFEGGVNQFKSASVVLRQWPCKLNPVQACATNVSNEKTLLVYCI